MKTKKADSSLLIANRSESPSPEVAAKCHAASLECAARFERAAATARSLRRNKAALEATMMAQEHRRRAEYYAQFMGRDSNTGNDSGDNPVFFADVPIGAPFMRDGIGYTKYNRRTAIRERGGKVCTFERTATVEVVAA